MMTREQLAAMTDDEMLAFQRAKHGNPYMPLSMAKKMQREEYKWRHATVLAEKGRRRGNSPPPSRHRQIRSGDGSLALSVMRLRGLCGRLDVDGHLACVPCHDEHTIY